VIPRPRRCCATTLILLCAAASAPSRLAASELVQRDLTFTIGEVPSAFGYTATDANGSRTGSDAFSQNIGVAVGGRYSFSGPGDSSGLVIGAALVANQASYQSLGHYTGYGLQASGGYGWAVTDSWSVGGRALVGYGLATFDLQANSAFPAISSSGTTLTYGAMVDLDYTITEKLTVLLDLGYQQTSANLSGGGVTLKLNEHGFAGALGIAWRFSASPRPLE
jgi:hypothetical protein